MIEHGGLADAALPGATMLNDSRRSRALSNRNRGALGAEKMIQAVTGALRALCPAGDATTNEGEGHRWRRCGHTGAAINTALLASEACRAGLARSRG